MTVNGVSASCNGVGQCSYTPTQNQSTAIVTFQGLQVFSGQLAYTTYTIQVQSNVAVVYLINCVSATLTFDGSSGSVSCSGPHYYLAPTAAGQITATDAGITQTVSYTPAEFSSFVTTFNIMMYYPVSLQMVDHNNQPRKALRALQFC